MDRNVDVVHGVIIETKTHHKEYGPHRRSVAGVRVSNCELYFH